MVNHKAQLKKDSKSGILVYLLLTVISITYLYPLIWLVINSLKTDQEMFNNP